MSVCIIAIMACTFMLPLMQNVKANASYQITFKSGLHGTIEGQKAVSYMQEAGSIFPDEPTVQAQDGYVFTGWNKQLPTVGSQVDRKLVFVATYDVLVNGISYIVHYEDEKGLAIATPKTTMGESGSKIVERAKVVSGYTYKESEQTFTLSKNKKEITFVYTSDNTNEKIRYEEEQVNVTEADQNARATAQGNENLTNGNDTDTNKKNTINKEEKADENKTPKAKGNTVENNLPVILGSVAGLILLSGIVIYVIMKKRKQKEA